MVYKLHEHARRGLIDWPQTGKSGAQLAILIIIIIREKLLLCVKMARDYDREGEGPKENSSILQEFLVHAFRYGHPAVHSRMFDGSRDYSIVIALPLPGFLGMIA
jgi:hypothetical protein